MRLMIPSSFKLLAHRIRVKSIPAAEWEYEDHVGSYNAVEQTILLRDDGGTLPGHTFCHELTHAILTSMGHPLNDQESFVDNFSGLLHQALTTTTYPRQLRRTRKAEQCKNSVTKRSLPRGARRVVARRGSRR